MTATIATDLDRASLAPLLADLAGRHHVPAAQLAVHTGDTTVTVSSGPLGARFPVGSITKAFTATLVMVLAAERDIGLDDPIGEHLDGLGPVVGAVPVRRLLDHTGGLPSAPADHCSVRRFLRSCREDGLVQPSGAGFSYSSTGYVLLGLAVEEITGMSWWEALTSLVLEPTGIGVDQVTGGPASDGPVVAGHTVHPVTHRARAVEQTIAPLHAPAGALALSAADLVRFGLAHCAGEPAGPEPTRLMRSPQPGADPFGLADGWGLGLAVYRGPDGGGAWAGHDGNADGTSCHLRIDPEHGRVVALTTNSGTGAAMWADLVTGLRERGLPVGDHDLAGTTPPGATGAWPPRDVAGTYVNGAMEYVVDLRTDGTAVLVVGGEAHPDLAVAGDGSFSVLVPATGHRIVGGRFVRDPRTGRVTGVQAGGRVARRRTAA